MGHDLVCIWDYWIYSSDRVWQSSFAQMGYQASQENRKSRDTVGEETMGESQATTEQQVQETSRDVRESAGVEGRAKGSQGFGERSGASMRTSDERWEGATVQPRNVLRRLRTTLGNLNARIEHHRHGHDRDDGIVVPLPRHCRFCRPRNVDLSAHATRRGPSHRGLRNWGQETGTTEGGREDGNSLSLFQ